MSVAVILGSAFDSMSLGSLRLEPLAVGTAFGEVTLHRVHGLQREAYALFRHGLPHRYLPQQIPYRGHAAALQKLGCEALLVTSSVGVLDAEVPLHQPLVVTDLLMPDNRLPDGSACSMFVTPEARQGHLVLEEGLFSKAISAQLRDFLARQALSAPQELVFAYVGGPRTKTAAENVYWRQAGAQVNSMTLGPEVVLANELEIPTAALVVGHKYSTPERREALDQESIADSLQRAQVALTSLVQTFLEEGEPVPFANRIYRFADQHTKASQ